MDWIKVKVKHIDYDFEGVDPVVSWAWIRMMSMCAALEKIPHIDQIKARIGAENFDALDKHLNTTGTDIVSVLRKVIEDVKHCHRKRKHTKEYMRRYRDVSDNVSSYIPTGRRLRGDKIREDKIRDIDSSIGTNEKASFFEKLKANPVYSHINIEDEVLRMKAWLDLPRNKGRKLTDKFMLNWLNKIDKPVVIPAKPKPIVRPVIVEKKEPELTDEQRKELSQSIKNLTKKLST